MTGLDNWLRQAARTLASDSAARVRTEIQEHYESAREAAMSGGAAADEADGLALGAPGDARTANCQYRRVLLTSAEARLLRKGNLHSLAKPLVPMFEMGGDKRRTAADLWAGHAQMVLAVDFMPVASGVDRMDTRFYQAETACFGVAQAVVSLSRE